MPLHAFLSRKSSAFTLLEAVITAGLLMVLLMVSYSGYQRIIHGARGTENLSNHRTIIRGLIAYASEHNSRLPWGNDLNARPGFSTPYTRTLATLGYVPDARAFFNDKFWRRCGDKEGAMRVITELHRFPNSIHPWDYTTYGVNRYGAMPTSSDGRKPANLLNVAKDGNLSRLIVTRDVYQPINDTPAKRAGGGTFWFSGDGFLPPVAETYNGMVHAGFADGHVESIPHAKIAQMLTSGTAAPIFHNIYTMN